MEWAQLATDLGSVLAPWATSGLAGLILCWLFFWHLPAKDAQLDRQMASRDLLIKETRSDFKDALAAVVAHCDQEIARQAEFDKLRDQRLEASLNLRDEKVESTMTDLREVLEGVRDALAELKRS